MLGEDPAAPLESPEHEDEGSGLPKRVPLAVRVRRQGAKNLASKISEQQIGLAIVRHFAAGDLGRYADFTSVMYTKSATGQEVDFCGRPVGIAFEGKYVDSKLAGESQTMRSMFSGGVLATRAVIETVDTVRAIPAYLMNR